MTLRFTPVVLQMLAAMVVMPVSASELIYEGLANGIPYKLYFDKVEALGDERFRFKTRAVFQTAKPTADFISDWGTANCKNQTLYGKPAPKIAEFGYQSGSPQLYAAICGEKP